MTSLLNTISFHLDFWTICFLPPQMSIIPMYTLPNLTYFAIYLQLQNIFKYLYHKGEAENATNSNAAPNYKFILIKDIW